MHDEHTSVLVVGGGLTGLSAAALLAWHGVPCLLVERHPDLLIHPRARGFTPRTVEIYRQIGLEPAIKAAGFASGEDFVWAAVNAETLASEVHVPAEDQQEEDSGFGDASPSSFAPIDQDKLEVLLRDRARALGADVRFSTEMTSFTEDEGGVTAVIEDRRTGAAGAVRADYLIAADGWKSPIRERLGIEADGPGVLYHTITAMVEADLTPALRGRRVNIAYLQRPRPFTILMAHDDAGQRWIFGTGYDPAHESLDDYTEERVVGMVREAAGLPDVTVHLRAQIPGTDIKVLGFAIGAQVARRYRAGRVFLAGDAARMNPPTGGLGANTGIQDAHNLAWKLAAVLGDQAGPALLDTYHDERHPTGLLTMQQAFARFGSRMAAGAEAPLVSYGAVAMGYRYRSAAIVGAPENTAPLRPEELRGEPGTRAPHVPVVRGGTMISTIDLYGRNFVLLAGTNGAAWVSAAPEVAKRLNVPLDAYRFGGDLESGDLQVAHGIGADGAALVRPDGFVAWRSEGATRDPAAALAGALSALLARAATA